jgi:hypothetical protein
MHEEVLRRFFEGEASAAELAHDLEGALVSDNPGLTRHPIVDMTQAFEVQPHHLVRVCDAALQGEIQVSLLEAIGFCLVSSDAFHWDGSAPEGGRVAAVVYDWSAPEINYPLTSPNIRAWRSRLRGEEARFEAL